MNFNKNYRNIFIVDSREYWSQYSEDFVVKQDLVLTFDFGLKNLLENCGGEVLL
jgi:hypothetical protein